MKFTLITNKYSRFFSLMLANFFLLIFPDIFFAIFSSNFSIAKDVASILFMLGLSIVFLINKNRLLSVLFLLFIGSIQTIQFCHIKYFGTLISPASLHLMTMEIQDVFEESTYVFWNYIHIIILIILSLSGIYFISHCKLTNKYKLKNRYTICLILLFIAFPLFKFGEHNSNAIKFSAENSIRTFIGYIETNVTSENYEKKYEPYRIKRIKEPTNEPMTIVYIIGESSNYEHMSLFGYKEDTTPKLRKLAARSSSNFYYTVGIAGGINTLSSCKFMCNAIREPNNFKELSLDRTNLFKLAKQSGFKTFYISAQSNNLLSSIGGVPYIDVLITREQYPRQFSIKRDTFLFKLLHEQEFSDKNLIVIHQRCIHSPYKKTVPKSFVPSKTFSADRNQEVNLYDAAMLYNDSTIAGLFEIFDSAFNNFNGKYYIIFASDHNELLGKNGLFGHGILNPEVAAIPILIETNDEEFLKNIKNIFYPTHYDLCNEIIKLLGFRIINPNEEENIYYINGVDFSGRYGFIKFKKDIIKKQVIYLSD